MEAARVSALRGHDVTLYEKASKLGGLLPIAAIVKGRHPEDVPLIVEYLKGQLKQARVSRPCWARRPTSPRSSEMKPDVVFLATGASATIPRHQGDRPAGCGERRRPAQEAQACHSLRPALHAAVAHQVLHAQIGKNVVVIGGALQGCELAEFLAKRGRKVTIVETGRRCWATG